MNKSFFSFVFFLIFLSHAAYAADEAKDTQRLINDVDALLKQAETLRERFPGHVSTDQLRACSSQARPLREKGRGLMKQVRDTSVPFSVRMPLSQAADKTFECLSCSTDGAACGAAKVALNKAIEATKASGDDGPSKPVKKW